MAVPKISRRFHISGFGLGLTRSLEMVNMEPSLKIANMTVAIVGKYLRAGTSGQCGSRRAFPASARPQCSVPVVGEGEDAKGEHYAHAHADAVHAVVLHQGNTAHTTHHTTR
jgi:hypothetical protein